MNSMVREMQNTINKLISSLSTTDNKISWTQSISNRDYPNQNRKIKREQKQKKQKNAEYPRITEKFWMD